MNSREVRKREYLGNLNRVSERNIKLNGKLGGLQDRVTVIPRRLAHLKNPPRLLPRSYDVHRKFHERLFSWSIDLSIERLLKYSHCLLLPRIRCLVTQNRSNNALDYFISCFELA